MAARVLVIDAEPSTISVYQNILRREGFQVLDGGRGSQAIEVASKEDPDLIIIDQPLLTAAGLDLCQKIRQTPCVRATPLLIISGDRADGFSTRCLNSGADGHLVRPVDHQELLAHVRAVLRRPRTYFADDDVIQKGRMILRLGERRILFDKKEVDHLTPKEHELLKELILRSPRVVEKQALAMKVWGIPFEQLHRQTLDVHIQRVRLKLGRAAASFLKTVTLVGYQWLDPSKL